MAKQKWYVVTVGKDIGVFNTWLEVAPLVIGVSGSLYQSFVSEDEAHDVFQAEQRKGNTRITSRTRSRTTQSYSHQITMTENLHSSGVERGMPGSPSQPRASAPSVRVRHMSESPRPTRGFTEARSSPPSTRSAMLSLEYHSPDQRPPPPASSRSSSLLSERQASEPRTPLSPERRPEHQAPPSTRNGGLSSERQFSEYRTAATSRSSAVMIERVGSESRAPSSTKSIALILNHEATEYRSVRSNRGDTRKSEHQSSDDPVPASSRNSSLFLENEATEYRITRTRSRERRGEDDRPSPMKREYTKSASSLSSPATGVTYEIRPPNSPRRTASPVIRSKSESIQSPQSSPPIKRASTVSTSSSPPTGVTQEQPLSPLLSPKLTTAERSARHFRGQSSSSSWEVGGYENASVPGRLHDAEDPSVDHDRHLRLTGSPQRSPESETASSSFRRREHVCPNCHYSSSPTSIEETLSMFNGFSQPAAASTSIYESGSDPRSPMRSGVVLPTESPRSPNFGRPSPHFPVERMSALYIIDRN